MGEYQEECSDLWENECMTMLDVEQCWEVPQCETVQQRQCTGGPNRRLTEWLTGKKGKDDKKDLFGKFGDRNEDDQDRDLDQGKFGGGWFGKKSSNDQDDRNDGDQDDRKLSHGWFGKK